MGKLLGTTWNKVVWPPMETQVIPTVITLVADIPINGIIIDGSIVASGFTDFSFMRFTADPVSTMSTTYLCSSGR